MFVLGKIKFMVSVILMFSILPSLGKFETHHVEMTCGCVVVYMIVIVMGGT